MMHNLKTQNSKLSSPVPLSQQHRTENYVYIVFVPNTCILTWRADNSTIRQMWTLVNIRPSVTAVQKRGLCPSTFYITQKYWTCPLSKGIEDSNSYCGEKHTVYIYCSLAKKGPLMKERPPPTICPISCIGSKFT